MLFLITSISIMTNFDAKAPNTAQSVTPGFAPNQPASNPSRSQKARGHNTPKHISAPSTPGNRAIAGSSSFEGSVPPGGKPPRGNSGDLPELPGFERRDTPYIWPSWLAKLISGEAQCEFQYWLKANYKYPKLPGNFDLEQYKINHNTLLQHHAQQLVSEGLRVRKEDQNSFTIRGKTATIGGKPDLIALGAENTIGECKTGQRKASDVAQLKIYMYLAPLAKLHGITTPPDGLLIYHDEVFEIPASEIEDSFKQLVHDAIAMLTSPNPPTKAPSARECRFCDVPIDICSARLESSCDAETNLF
jgi:CRISPR/Cas system-associated exonuclease Cas4 (RecB family)